MSPKKNTKYATDFVLCTPIYEFMLTLDHLIE